MDESKLSPEIRAHVSAAREKAASIRAAMREDLDRRISAAVAESVATGGETVTVDEFLDLIERS